MRAGYTVLSLQKKPAENTQYQLESECILMHRQGNVGNPPLAVNSTLATDQAKL